MDVRSDQELMRKLVRPNLAVAGCIKSVHPGVRVIIDMYEVIMRALDDVE